MHLHCLEIPLYAYFLCVCVNARLLVVSGISKHNISVLQVRFDIATFQNRPR